MIPETARALDLAIRDLKRENWTGSVAPVTFVVCLMGAGKSFAPSRGRVSDFVLQPIMLFDLPVKVRSWELAVYPRSHIRRWFGATQPAQARM